MQRNRVTLAILITATASCWMISGAVSQSKVQSRAYVGHTNDQDIQNFVSQYPKTSGTRLDDCQTCHCSGMAGTDAEREFSPCGYCHLLQYPKAKYKTGVPQNFGDTLNAYGISYKQEGRTAKSIAAIAKLDSDGDGSSNETEIARLHYPGDAASQPGQPLAPVVTFSLDDIKKLPLHRQFMLLNASHESMDEYAGYSGVRVKDLLQAAGVDLSSATGITVFAPDGYSIDYTIEDVTKPFPRGYFYAGPRTIKNKEGLFVHYPESIPPGAMDSKEIQDEPWLLLAYHRDGKLLNNSIYEKGTGRLSGEGPYRLVKPQRDLSGDPSKPGRPDRSVKAKVFGDGWDYSKDIDHNAGFCVRGAAVIRINPMPSGFEEYDWKNGWPLVSEKKLVIYGKGVPQK